jgi:hypothetical protein
MSGLFIAIATHRLKQSRPPGVSSYPSAGLIGPEMRAITARRERFQRAAGKPPGAYGPG